MALNLKHMCDSPDMLCLDDDKILLKVYDTTQCSKQKKLIFECRLKRTVKDIFSDVARLFSYDDFELILQPTNDENSIFLNDKQNLEIKDITSFIRGEKNTVLLMPSGSWAKNPNKKIFVDNPLPTLTPSMPIDHLSDDDLALGASASPTETTIPNDFNNTNDNNTSSIPIPPVAPALPAIPVMAQKNQCKIDQKNIKFHSKLLNSTSSSTSEPNSGYVGLVNQAMTCYLNSLLQALFMTPEFRNALYKMKFNIKEKSIPFQLQKLFVNLQTSPKMAVETTDLTKSFGWDSTQAWTQHDIQELCRVMFDALEKEFQRTKQENWINKFYEGKMIDYVKCLECGIEKTREDTFLDIPLPLRPFGNNKAYESVEEALRAFVQPETLEGNNQYFCEKCNKKCDAHKGLKFIDFPYILTLHLKRFDFNYQTLHRIKLNDKVTFPQTLNLNCFINATDTETFTNLKNTNNNQTQLINGLVSSVSSENENSEATTTTTTTTTTTKFDDCSITDSGAALEEDNCSGFGTTASSSHHESELQEDDEGIEISTTIDNNIRCQLSHTSGPYIYELFSIMVHSGSASGGHYYAYIKDFDTGEWYCFNDQSVTPITQEDIQKSFGGDSFRAYYSGIYSSSTNAYMLMYRRIDPEQNEKAINVDEFPENITNLQQFINDSEQEEKKRRIETEIIKPKVYFYNPKLKRMKDVRIYLTRNSTLENALDVAYGLLKIQQFAPITRCRLVAYDHYNEHIGMSFEGKEKDCVEDLLDSLPTIMCFLLEIRDENEEFQIYKSNRLTLEAFKLDLNTFELDGPQLLWLEEKNVTKIDVKKSLANKLKVNYDDTLLVALSYPKNIKYRNKNENQRPNCVIYATEMREGAEEILNKFATEICPNLTYIYATVPPTDEKSLESLCIPPYEHKKEQSEMNCCAPKQSPLEENGTICNNAGDSGDSGGGGGGGGDVTPRVLNHEKNHFTVNTWLEGGNNQNDDKQQQRKSSPLPPVTAGQSGGGHESEDSSLSDGDRTLVESLIPNDFSNGSSPAHSPQLSSPDDDNCEKSKIQNKQNNENLYIRAVEIENDQENSSHHHHHYNSSSINDNSDDTNRYNSKNDPNKIYKIFIDNRMSIENFKNYFQKIIGVSSENFKISKFSSGDLCDFLRGEQINIELERYLKKNEIKVKIYYLKLKQLNNYIGKFLPICRYVIQTDKTLIDIKLELINYLHKLNSNYSTLKLENCRIWKKWCRNLDTIINDDSYISDLTICRSNCELIIQECDEHANMNTNNDTVTIFVRRWYPTDLKLGAFDEITLEKNTDIKKALASISSDISEEDIAYTIPSSVFPFNELSVLEIRNKCWYTHSATKNHLNNIENGSLCIYKNIKEEDASLTEKDELEIRLQERKRIEANNGTSSLLSPRKEHALKIYLDTSSRSIDD